MDNCRPDDFGGVVHRMHRVPTMVDRTTNLNQLPVLVIGAGPVGLAAAAHLLILGLDVRVFEAGPGPGTHLDEVRHVRLFTPWRYNVNNAASRLLADTGWNLPDQNGFPTAGELVDSYLRPLVAHPLLSHRIHFGACVTAVARLDRDKLGTPGRDTTPFVVRVSYVHGRSEEHIARAVIDATGTWGQPNPLGVNGLPANGEHELRDRIAYGMPDVLNESRARYAGKNVLVVGAGYSAAGALLAITELQDAVRGTRIHWVVRNSAPKWLERGPESDFLPARGRLGQALAEHIRAKRITLHTNFRIQSVQEGPSGLVLNTVNDTGVKLQAIDEIIAATGSRPNFEPFRELVVRLDSRLECIEPLVSLIDPAVHDCVSAPLHGYRELTHPEPNFYVVGAKSYGRAPTFLLATGYEQVRSIASALAGDWEAADRVESESIRPADCCHVCGPAESTVEAKDSTTSWRA